MPPASVYNVVVAPLKSRNPVILDSSKIGEATLFIGPKVEASLVAPTQVDERFRALAAGNRTPINVQMVCTVCIANGTQNRVILFDPVTTSSTAAKFEIHVDPDTKGRLGRIYFRLSMNGLELNHIELHSFVDFAPKDASGYREPRVEFLPLASDAGAPPDVTISVTPDNASGKVAVTVEPQLPQLASALQGLHLDPQGNPRKFGLSHNSSADELKRRSRDAYWRLRQMTNPSKTTRDRLEKMYRALNLPTFEGGFPSNPVQLIPDHRDEALRVFKVAGQDLYRALFTSFMGAPADLHKVMDTIENFSAPDKRALRVSVASPYYLPWQMLYPNFADTGFDEVDSRRFWGFKYELSVRQIVQGQEHRLESSALRPTAGNVVFAKGRNRSPNDSVESLADELMKRLFASSSPSSGRVVTSSKDLVSALTSGADDLMLVFLFSHATSGSHMLWTDDVPISATDSIGPRILFSDDDWVAPETLERIFDAVKTIPVWKKQPIFVLNACETGTGGDAPENGGLFVTTLTKMGANAVVVTESEVWAKFASAWATTLVEGLRKGEDVPRAVRNARVKHLQENNNPMGLLYSLYGSPTARVVIPSNGF